MKDHPGYRTQKRMSKKKEKRRRALRWLIMPVAIILVFIIVGAFARVSPVSKWWDKTADGFQWVGRKLSTVWP